ncbi:MAG: nucleotidyltransferase family protein [Clostridium sp.]|nr:MAG: nucleotidyltransferase family protein [Clostridium sp.]
MTIIFLKGSVISSLYPDVALRSRGDIDIVVRKDDYKRAKANF